MQIYFNTSHVTVYLVPVHTCSSNQSISIHLMLLFIRKIEFIPIGFKHFNTSHVTVYRSTIYINVTIYTDFNTSHVTVYHHKLLPFCPIFSFQYISCYCLSICPVFLDSSFLDFNTSHVTVYLYVVKGFQGDNLEFQYISCYCLSKKNSILATKNLYFNTSHVTVYHLSRPTGSYPASISIHLMLLFIYTTNKDTDTTPSFQYISCYCLSSPNMKADIKEFLFQYISCYCLSLSFGTFIFVWISFQYISCYCLSLIDDVFDGKVNDFNTSHVTVYRLLSSFRHVRLQISIHLMLLFIDFQHTTADTLCQISIHLMLLFIIADYPDGNDHWIFQYISCYCLSIWNTPSVLPFLKFQYISCYCLSPYRCCYNRVSEISIHLMLLFIPKECFRLQGWSDFNTSHVTVYHGSGVAIPVLTPFQYISCYCLSSW